MWKLKEVAIVLRVAIVE